jgi:hypothetical protein
MWTLFAANGTKIFAMAQMPVITTHAANVAILITTDDQDSFDARNMFSPLEEGLKQLYRLNFNMKA